MEENRKHICKYCGKEFKSGQALGGHIVLCKMNPTNSLKTVKQNKKEKFEKENPLQEYILRCKVCEKEYKLIMRKKSFESGKYKQTCSTECAHKFTAINTDLSEKNNKISNTLNKLLDEGKLLVFGNKAQRNRIFKCVCKICGKEFESIRYRVCCSQKCINKCTSIALKASNNAGGLRPNAYKKYKSGTYHGVHCDSSWELAFVIYCEDHNIELERNKQYLTYIFENKEYKYYPDFIINGKLYEIKGFEDPKAKEKHKQHPEVEYLDKYKMQPYIKYVEDKYGKDFIKMYDKMDKIPE